MRINIFIIFLAVVFINLRCSSNGEFSYTPHRNGDFLSSTRGCDHKLNDGTCLFYKKEIFEISSTIPLDVIFILDVSRSMEPILKKIGNGFSSLIESIDDLDWQMVFTTADHGDHRFFCENDQWNEDGTDCAPGVILEFPKKQDQWEEYKGSLPRFGRFMFLQHEGQILENQILNSKFEDRSQIFYNTITRNFPFEQNNICSYPPYCQQGDNEQPLRVLKSIFSQASSTHKNFFRKNVDTVVFIVTNEPERSEDSSRATVATEVFEEFSRVFYKNNKRKKLIVYGISIQDENCLEEQGLLASASSNFSKNLSELVQKTGGVNIDICTENYASYFSEISKHIHGRVKSLSLQFKPVVQESVGVDIVMINPEKEKTKFHLEGNVFGRDIALDKDILPGSQIEVKYYYGKENFVK